MTAIEVDAPNVDVRARLAVSHHIDNRPAPLNPFTAPHARRPENQRRREGR